MSKNLYAKFLCALLVFSIMLPSVITPQTFVVAALPSYVPPAATSSMYWPANHLLPMFPPMAAVIDDINESYLSVPEAVAIAALQGYVNRVEPRIVLTKNNGFEDAHGRDPNFAARGSTVAGSMDPWLDRLAAQEGFTRNRILPSEVWPTIVARYYSYINGFVLYDFTHSAFDHFLGSWRRGDAAEWDITHIPAGEYKVVMDFARESAPQDDTGINWGVQVAGG